MRLQDVLGTVAGSAVEDWAILFRPTFRYRVSGVPEPGGSRDRLEVDEHRIAFSYKPDIAITMAYGLVEEGAYQLPPGHRFAQENARTLYVDIFLEGRLVFRETVVSVDRHRGLLPMPRDWNPPIQIPVAQYSLVRLLHALAGPPTDFEEYFTNAGMKRSGDPWP